jgi:hypothetical protein
MRTVEHGNMQMTLKSRVLCCYITRISFENVEKDDRNSVELNKHVTTFRVDLKSKTYHVYVNKQMVAKREIAKGSQSVVGISPVTGPHKMN